MWHSRCLTFGVLITAGLTWSAPRADASASSPPFILGLQPGVPPELVGALGFNVLEARDDLGLFLVTLPPGVTARDVESLASTPAWCRFIEPDQTVVADFIREGHFARHIRRMRRLYATRRELLVESLRRHLGGMIDVGLPASGTHVVMYLRNGISDVDACRVAAANGVVTTPLSSAYIGAGQSGLLLGYASVRGPLIERGVRQLAMALQSLVPASPLRPLDHRVAG